MARRRLSSVLHYIRGLAGRMQAEGSTDGQLLQQFVAAKDERAFATLVERHGPRVLGVCRRVLANADDVDDAFQATFLVLAAKARSISKREAVGSWLCGVAYRVALKARVRAARWENERPLCDCTDNAQEDPASAASRRELCAVVDEELSRLPAKYRAPLLFCDGEGQSWALAARELRWPLGTLQRRLMRGRELLRRRLERRGVVLPAAALAALIGGQTVAAVPVRLADATIKIAALFAAGQPAAKAIATTTAALAEAVIRTMCLGKLKLAASILILTVAVAAGAAVWATNHADSQKEGSGRGKEHGQKQYPPPPPAEPAQPPSSRLIAGAVIDADGRAVPNAEVGVLFTPKRRRTDVTENLQALVPVKTDAAGRFRFPPRRIDWDRFQLVQLLAAAPGRGLAWQNLAPERDRSKLVLKMQRERIIKGRLLDLQGSPAAGVRVHLSFVGREIPFQGRREGISIWDEQANLPVWPKPVPTDAQGRFVLRGLGDESVVAVELLDERFARQMHTLPKRFTPSEELTLALAPAHMISGQVTCADTGKPLPNTRLNVSAGQGRFGGPFMGMGARCDAQGRFRVNPFPGDYFYITAEPPPGEPYLVRRLELSWPKGAARHEVKITVPRGALIRGKITETASGKPVAGATVQFLPREINNPNLREHISSGAVLSGADGSYQIAAPPGPGHLFVHGPTADYIQIEIHSNKVYYDKAGGGRMYAHAQKAVLAGADVPLEVDFSLQRGVSVKGRVLDSGGKPVVDALMITRLATLSAHNFQHWRTRAVPVREGVFELHGLDPAETYRVFFLDPKNKEGAVARIAGKDAGAKPVTVRLMPCGAAVVRCVDAKGKPLAGQSPILEIIVQPGVHPFDRTALEKGLLFADTEFVSNLDRLNYWNGPKSDAQGRVTLPALIPGADYVIVPRTARGKLGPEFRVEAGKSINLPDVVIAEIP